MGQNTFEISCAVEDSEFIHQLACTDIVHKLGLHLLKNCTQEGDVVAALGEEQHSTTPNPGNPTSPPDEEVPGEC